MDPKITAVFEHIRRCEKMGLKYTVVDRTNDITTDELIMLELDKNGYKVASNEDSISVWW